MHVVIINGSPRVEQFSNTEKIIDAFAQGVAEAGASYERYAISNRNSWDAIKEAYLNNNEILIALPLYVENIPGLLLEFFETLPAKDEKTRMSFILQGGFAEASQLRCGEAFLEKLPGYLGIEYGGTLIKGDNFGIRVVTEEQAAQITGPYEKMGKAFVTENGFFSDQAKEFAGPEYFTWPIRVSLQLMFKTMAKKRYQNVAKEWGCEVPIDYKPWR